MPSEAALISLKKIMTWLCQEYNINPVGIKYNSALTLKTPVALRDFPDKNTPTIMGHRQLQNKDCPGELFFTTFSSLRTELANCSSHTANNKAFSFKSYGSIVSNASLFIKKSNQWYLKGVTDENGYFDILENLTVGDSLKIQANGYFPMSIVIDTFMITNRHIYAPFFKRNSTIPLVNPFLKVSKGSVSIDSVLSIKLGAENIIKSQILVDSFWVDVASTQNATNYTMHYTELLDTSTYEDIRDPNDFEINCRIISLNDTIYLNKSVSYFINRSQLDDNTFKVRINVQNYLLNSELYLNGIFECKITSLDTVIRLLKGNNEIKLNKIGFIDTSFFVNSDTVFNFQAYGVPETTQESNLNLNNSVGFMHNTSVKSSQLSNINLKRYFPNYSNLKLIPKSGTYKLEKQSNSSDTTALLTILDQPEYLSLDSVYLLNKKNGVFKKIFANQFADSIVYDSSIQKLGHFKLYGNSEELVLMKKQKPIKNTSTGFRIHESETLTIPLSDLFKDPDGLPNDMTYSFVADSSFSFLIVGDSVRIKHINCKSGNLSFTLEATHDQLSVPDTFNIYVTPLSIISTVRTVKCFGTATGKIEVSMSSDKPQLYSYLWSNSVNTRINDSILAGTYRITVNDQNNCKTLKTIEVTQPTALTVNLGIDIKLDLGDSTQLTPSVNRTLLQGWKWTPSEGLSCNTCEKPYARPLQTTEYKLVATDTSNCSGNDVIRVFVANKEKVFIPNAFSPNQDGVNDILFVNCGNEVRKINKFYIFNRWGAQVFAANNFLPNDEKFGWNGTFKGVAAAEGVYIYTVEVEYINGKTQIFSGDVNIIK